MKYTNANLILPEELIEKIQEYVQGEYIYIPIKDKGINTFSTDYKIELKKRDAHIFLLGLLSEEEKMEITELQWFDLVMDVFSGYEKKIVLSITEKEMVPCVMECIELLFVAYFVKINDIICAENAFKIFEFLRACEERIRKMI